MANELIIFKRGVSANLPPTKTAGQVLFETDTGAMYIDDSDSTRVQIRDTSKVQKTGDVMTGVLSVDVTSASLTSLDTQSSDVKGLLGVQIDSSTSVPFIHAATKNNLSGGTGVALTSGGLTLVGGGENALKILNNAANGSGSTDSSGSTILSPAREELILASDNGISFFTGGETSSPSCFINSNGSMTVNAPTNSNHATTKAYVDGRSSHIFAGDGVTIGNSATVNGNTKISLSNIENSTVDSSITLAGILGTHVSSSRNGVISIGNGIATTNRSAAISETESENWQVVAGGTITGTADLNIAFLVTDSFTHASGILNLGFRCSNGQGVTDWFPNNGLRLNWLSRHADINPNHYRIRLINSTTPTNSCSWTLEAYHHRQNYAVSFEVLAASGYAGSNPPPYSLYTNGAAAPTGGTILPSADILPKGGTWNSSTYRTDSAGGIAIGGYEGCLADNLSIAIGGSRNFPTAALLSSAIAMGYGTHASGTDAIAIGDGCIADASKCCAIGSRSEAHGAAETIPLAGGNGISVAGHSIAMGYTAVAQANSSTAIGNKTQAVDFGSFVCGFSNSPTATANRRTSGLDATKGNVFIVGNGTYKSGASSLEYNMSNAFRVTTAGAVYAKAAYNSSGADYAEFIKEWYDGNIEKEDRVGYMVTIGADGKLHKANAGDHILGITSGNPSVVGNADEDYLWKYERDVFNRPIIEEHEEKNIKMDEEGNPVTDESGNIIYETTGTIIHNFKLRSDYDPSQQESYVERKDRPEWDYVGMRGIIPCRDDGTCVAGGFCKCGENGIATYASQQDFNTYYVIERLSENVVSVEVK